MVSVLDRYKFFMSCCVVVTTSGEVLSVCVCKDSRACSIVMALYGSVMVSWPSSFASSSVVCSVGWRL